MFTTRNTELTFAPKRKMIHLVFLPRHVPLYFQHGVGESGWRHSAFPITRRHQLTLGEDCGCVRQHISVRCGFCGKVPIFALNVKALTYASDHSMSCYLQYTHRGLSRRILDSYVAWKAPEWSVSCFSTFTKPKALLLDDVNFWE